jgi:hypothetical protein
MAIVIAMLGHRSTCPAQPKSRPCWCRCCSCWSPFGHPLRMILQHRPCLCQSKASSCSRRWLRLFRRRMRHPSHSYRHRMRQQRARRQIQYKVLVSSWVEVPMSNVNGWLDCCPWLSAASSDRGHAPVKHDRRLTLGTLVTRVRGCGSLGAEKDHSRAQWGADRVICSALPQAPGADPVARNQYAISATRMIAFR